MFPGIFRLLRNFIATKGGLNARALLLAAGLTAGAAPVRAQTVTATLPVGINPNAVAVNPATNKIYVPNFNGGSVTVIDGATNGTATVAAGVNPDSAGVNPVTNKIYVVNNTSTVPDGVEIRREFYFPLVRRRGPQQLSRLSGQRRRRNVLHADRNRLQRRGGAVRGDARPAT
jgi:hypothetical protein